MTRGRPPLYHCRPEFRPGAATWQRGSSTPAGLKGKPAALRTGSPSSLRRTISHHGVRPNDVPGEPARHRSLSRSAPLEVVRHGAGREKTRKGYGARPSEGNSCPRPANRDTTQDAGAIAEPRACRALAPECIAGAADQLPLLRPAQGGGVISLARVPRKSKTAARASAPRRRAVNAGKPARAFMTAIGESCRRRGHAGASAT
jgi:hypothetical protein